MAIAQNNDNSKRTAEIFRSPISIMTVACVSTVDGVGGTVEDLEVPKV